MEKQSEKTIQEQKADIIRRFAEALDKNTTTPHEVWCIIHALLDACEFMEDKRYKYESELSMNIRYMRGKLEKGTEQMLYDDITDDVLEAIMVSRRKCGRP